MTVLNEFFLLFKTDAKQAQKDIEGLEKQISSLAAKGKARTEQETKDLKELRKQRAAATQDLKDQTKEADNLSESLSKAAAALAGFAAVRQGMISATTFNSDLRVQSDLLRQNARDLDVYSTAARNAGGSREGFLGDINKVVSDARSRGIDPGKFTDWIKNVQSDLSKFKDPNAKAQRLDQIGINDPGFRRMLLNGTLDADLAKASENIGSKTDKDYDVARQTMENTSSMDANIDRIFSFLTTKLGSDISGFVQGAGGSALQAIGGFAIGGAILKRLGFGGAVSAAGGVGAAAAGVALPIAAVATVGAGVYQHKSVAGWIDRQFNGATDDAQYKRLHAGGAPAAAGGGDYASDMAYFMSQGYTREQAAGIVANIQRESAGDPSARGDGGKAHGLFQWHPDRRAGILKGTGIDVSSAGREDQLKAAAWELQSMGLDKRLKGINNANSAAAFFSMNFERPANGDFEAMTRGRMAMDLASKAGGGVSAGSAGGGATVSIGKIDVNTQATDADGIAQSIGDKLSSVLGNLAANVDDGVNA